MFGKSNQRGKLQDKKLGARARTGNDLAEKDKRRGEKDQSAL